MFYLDDVNTSLYENASFCSCSSIWHNWECVLIPHRLENWPLKLSQQCLCSTDRFPGEDWGSKPSGPLDSVGFIRKSSSTTAKSELCIRGTVSIKTFQLARIFSTCLLLPVKMYSSHEDRGTQWKRNIADAAAPNSWHWIPEGSPTICNSNTHKQPVHSLTRVGVN